MIKSTDNGRQVDPSEFVYEKQNDLFGGPETCVKVRKTKVVTVPEKDRREPSERGQFFTGKSRKK